MRPGRAAALGSLAAMSDYEARLTDRVRTRGRLGADDAARLLLPLADSLAGLHAVGAHHGSIGPDAVLVDADGRATLLDRIRAVADPAYCAPDPTGGLRSHPAADDVWSFGAVLHFVTTGTGPDEPDTLTRNPGWLGPLVELSLHPDPRQRPTMAEVADYLRPRGVEPTALRTRPSGAVMALIGGAGILVLGMIGALLLFGSGSDEKPSPGAQPSTSAVTTPPADSETPGATASAEPRTDAELEDFARTYVATASSDPAAGFAMLTREYQQNSPRYEEVWGDIDDPEILQVSGAPDTLSVTYVYRYRLAGNGRRTEEVTLRLVEQGDDLLIAGASARPL